MEAKGIEGYGVEADRLARRYDAVPPADKFGCVMHIIPSTACRVLDVGSGSGVDAAWFASKGHEVVAAEPTQRLREHAERAHASPRITWMDDCLPRLRCVRALGKRFDFIVVAGVWTHLDESERRDGLQTLASLASEGGSLLMSIRHGSPPAGRRSFPVCTRETIALAENHGLRLTLQEDAESVQPANRAASVTWTWLGFRLE